MSETPQYSGNITNLEQSQAATFNVLPSSQEQLAPEYRIDLHEEDKVTAVFAETPTSHRAQVESTPSVHERYKEAIKGMTTPEHVAEITQVGDNIVTLRHRFTLTA